MKKSPLWKNFLYFGKLNFVAPSLKRSCFLFFFFFLKGELLMVFHHCFIRCFHFTTDFYYCFSGVFFVDCICSFHQLFLPWLFFYQVLRFCGVVLWALRIWESSFLLSGIFCLKLLPHICHSTASATDLKELFLLSSIFYLLSFLTFGTICFYEGFPGSCQYFLEGCSASYWGSKYRSRLSVCLNHTVFNKRY